MTDEAMSPLRRRMIEDMTIRKFAPKTQHDYVQRVKNFAAFLGRSPDTASFEDVRRYQLHLAASGVGVPTLNQTVSTLRFFFRVTLRRPDIVEHTQFRPRAAQAAGGAQSGGSGAVARCSTRAQIQGGAERGLRRGFARRPRWSRSRYRDIDSKRMLHPRRTRQRPQRPVRDAVAASARTAARLVAGGTPAGLAVSRARSGAADDDAPAQSRLPCRGPDGRDRQARVAAHLAAQLCHPPLGAEHRYQGDPGAARKGDILPANNRLKHASLTDFILASARR